MYKITCDFCGNKHLFKTKEEQPKECANQACQNSLEGLEVKELENIEDNEATKTINGLKLIYQKTSEEVILNTEPKIILGRQNFGSEVLSKIKQVSRAHCSIELTDNQFHLFR